MNSHRPPSSRLPGLHRQPINNRQVTVLNWAHQAGCPIDESTWKDLIGPPAGLDLPKAELMIENTIGRYALPMGIATNFLINDRDRLIPMVIEEPSVIAGASNAARLMRLSGGIKASSDPSLMIGQIQLLHTPDTHRAIAALQEERESILDIANASLGSLVKRGGGAREIELREIIHPALGPMLIVHILVDCQDAMGANAVNSALEQTAPLISKISGGRVVLRILSNLSDRRLARAEAKIKKSVIRKNTNDHSDILQHICEAAALADVDPYRAATHNKGILNGIDAVVLATGNDWRAVEAGAHAYAAHSGMYRSLSQWRLDEIGDLHGTLELPLALGIVGGATQSHPGAKAALALLNVNSARELAEIVVSVGLAQNFAALLALAGEGIQQGHMKLHARQIALSAGATEKMVTVVAETLIAEGNIRMSRAIELVNKINQSGDIT